MKTIIITGANSGIGKAAAKKLAAEGHRVILACRSEEKGNEAAEEIITVTGNKRVNTMKIDLGSQASIKEFAETYSANFDRLDVLIHNAANFDLTMKSPIITEDGIELIFATNHVGPFLLTNLLLDLLKNSAPSRVITVASKGLVMYPGLKIEYDNLNGAKNYSAQHAYYHSKLAQVMFTYDQAKRLAGTGITANCIRVTNVAVADEKISHLPKWQQKLYKMKRKMALTPEQQADTYVYLATSPEVEGISGGYWDESNKRVKSSKYSYDEAEWIRLREATELLLTTL
jgi:NAD(P)-dependent dehydrogenase (short-subunit alcohol dehydrogenase family)